MTETDVFKHSTPALYDRYMGPLLFAPYAEHVAKRVAPLRPDRVLETAAGTGIVTRAVGEALPGVEIIATDLNPAVVEFAAQQFRSEGVAFQAADAQQLPFADESFDLVLCLFGIMFFPNKVGANAEARRVLRPGGRYLLVTLQPARPESGSRGGREGGCDALSRRSAVHGARPLQLHGRSTRRGGSSQRRVRDHRGGDRSCRVWSRPGTPHAGPSSAPFRAEIERLDPSALERATETVEQALRPWDGTKAPMSAHVATAIR